MTDADVAPPQIVGLSLNGNAIEVPAETLDAGESNSDGTLFRYSEGYWMYNLSTKGLTPGSYLLKVQLPNGSRYTTAFGLR